ncbi:MAG TPA: hypothetical protein VHA56_03460 [Mucilaginibacter sp.]|nr:hypothetical protein [Mucilaginibacter sp.]
MKKLAILSALAFSGLMFSRADAQVSLNVGLRVGPVSIAYTKAPVVAGPVYNDAYDDDYYYLPDVNAYYNIRAQRYFYFNGNAWVSALYLPGVYRDYDWRNARHYEIREHRPYINNEVYRTRYNGRAVADWSRHQDAGYDNRQPVRQEPYKNNQYGQSGRDYDHGQYNSNDRNKGHNDYSGKNGRNEYSKHRSVR